MTINPFDSFRQKPTVKVSIIRFLLLEKCVIGNMYKEEDDEHMTKKLGHHVLFLP